MSNDGYTDILNVDYSDVVIENMRKKHETMSNLTWRVMDIRDMTALECESFDVVIEKGTLDSLLVDEKNLWQLSDESEILIDTILRQVQV